MITKKFNVLLSLTLLASCFLTQISHAAFGTDHNISIHKQQTEKPAEIIGNIVTLRELKVDYFREYYEMFSLDVRTMIEFPREIGIIETYLGLFKEIRKHKNGQTFQYIIFDNTDNKLIGLIEIRDKNNATYGQFSCWINENYRGSNRFKEATDLISKAYFELTNTSSYTAHVRQWNTRSRAALIKLGFHGIGAHLFESGKIDRYIFEYNQPQS